MERAAHHKIRNNLQIVSSLINLQLHGTKEAAAREALVTLRQRVDALAVIHQVLSQAGDLQRVQLATLLTGLCRQLQSMVSAGDREISVVPMTAETTVDADQATILAMLAAEAVGHIARHAFPERRNGWVLLQSWRRDDGGLTLVVAGDGRPSFTDDESKELAPRIISGYTRQLRGELTVLNGAGTGIRVDLPVKAA